MADDIKLREFLLEKMKLNNKLELSIEDISNLEMKFGSIDTIGTLDFSGMPIKSIPEWVRSFKNVKVLNLSRTSIEKLPMWFGELSNLEHLNLNNSSIIELPKELCELRNLRTLRLSQIEITSLPNNFYKLTNLRKLYLIGTNITKLPNGLGKLKSLEVLDLFRSKIEMLPEDFCDLIKLTELDIKNTNIKNVPIEIQFRGVFAIKNYFEMLRENSIKKLYEAKLLFVGRGEVGKTSLAKKITNTDYKLRKEESTHGIDIIKYSFDAKIKGKEEKFLVNLWDFGGQEIYYSTHQFFLTKRSLYAFIWECRVENYDIDFDYWLNTIKLLSDSSPVFIILNKTDLRTREINHAELQKRFTNIAGFHRVSVLSGEGIGQFKNAIEEEIVKLSHVGDRWPESWEKVRKIIENDERFFINSSDYYKLCEDEGLSIENAKYLSSYLHDLGVILHFQDDSLLKQLVILKPEWATKAVYSVLDDKKIVKKNGVFASEDLERIWTDYPEDKLPHLLQLMIKFELCFKMEGIQKYILPELLPYAEQSVGLDEYRGLIFEYRYQFLPSGILERFIVRNYNYIKDKCFWKNAVILELEDTSAIIIRDISRKTVRIILQGIKKRDFLVIIKNEFDHIHDTLNNPEKSEMISCCCEVCSTADDPEFYDYKKLRDMYYNSVFKYPCSKSYKEILISDILGDNPNPNKVKNDSNNYYYGEVNNVKNEISMGNSNQNTQINLAVKEAKINSIQNNSYAEFISTLERYKEFISSSDLVQDDKAEVLELIESTEDELKKEKPRKSILKATLSKIKDIALLFNTIHNIQDISGPAIKYFEDIIGKL